METQIIYQRENVKIEKLVNEMKAVIEIEEKSPGIIPDVYIRIINNVVYRIWIDNEVYDIPKSFTWARYTYISDEVNEDVQKCMENVNKSRYEFETQLLNFAETIVNLIQYCRRNNIPFEIKHLRRE